MNREGGDYLTKAMGGLTLWGEPGTVLISWDCMESPSVLVNIVDVCVLAGKMTTFSMESASASAAYKKRIVFIEHNGKRDDWSFV